MQNYPWSLLAVYVFTVGGVQLVALWAATSARPWLLRALAVWTPIALLAAARVYEPALVLLMSAALTIAICWGVEWLASVRMPSGEKRVPQLRFRLADLLVLVLFLATWLGLTGRRVEPEHQLRLTLQVAIVALPLALLSIFVHRAAIGRQRIIMGIAALVIVWIMVLYLRGTNWPLFLGHWRAWLGSAMPRDPPFWIAVLGAMPLVVAGCIGLALGSLWAAPKLPAPWRRRFVMAANLLGAAIGLPTSYLLWDEISGRDGTELWLRLAEIGLHSIYPLTLAAFIGLIAWLWSAARNGERNWVHTPARAALITLAVVAAPPAAWIYCQMVWYRPIPKVELGPVNHYYRIAEIARRASEDSYFRGPMSARARTELHEAVGLLREDNNPRVYFQDPEFWGAEPRDWITGSQARWFSARLAEAAKEAAASGDYDRAADFATAIIRFDAMIDRSGTSVFSQEGYGLLREHRYRISSRKAREIAGLLKKTLDARFPAETIVGWNLAIHQSRNNWRTKLQRIIEERPSLSTHAATEDVAQLERRRRPTETINVLLQADLAIRAFQSERGRLPKLLEELVPLYLSELPVDPWSDESLKYQPGVGFFEVYSVGPDGIDNGGQFFNQLRWNDVSEFDVRLDPVTTAGQN